MMQQGTITVNKDDVPKGRADVAAALDGVTGYKGAVTLDDPIFVN